MTKADLKARIDDLEARMACYRRIPIRPASPTRTIDGKWAADFGYKYDFWTAGKPQLERAEVCNHRDTNVQAIRWDKGTTHPPSSPAIFRDLTLRGAKQPNPGALAGTGEANLRLGMPGEVSRVDCRDSGWMAIETFGQSEDPQGGCTGSAIQDIYAIQTRFGIYSELLTRETDFRRFYIEATEIGINVEWAQKINGKLQCSHDNLYESGVIDMSAATYRAPSWIDPQQRPVAVYVQPGNYGITLRNLIIPVGVIVLPTRTADPSRPNVVENCTDGAGNPTPIVHTEAPFGT